MNRPTQYQPTRPHATILSCEYPPFPGGIGTYAGELVDALRDEGVRATVIAPDYRDEGLHAPSQLRAEEDTHRLLGHHRIPPRAVLPLLRLLRNTPRDSLLLAADIRTTLLLYVLKPLHRRPYRAMVHGSEASKFRAGSPLARLVRRAYHGAHRVIYNSQATRQVFREAFGTPPSEAVAYLGVDPYWFEAAPDDFEAPVLRALPRDSRIFFTVGRLEERKGHLQALRTLAIARDKHQVKNLVYVAAGRAEPGDYPERLQREAQALGIQLVLPGRLSEEDLKCLARRACAHLLLAQPLPGKIEGFGLVLLETAGQGCPSIANNVGGIPEVLANSGSLVPHDELFTAAANIAAYAEDSLLRDTQGERARERAALFTWKACAERTFPELNLGV